MCKIRVLWLRMIRQAGIDGAGCQRCGFFELSHHDHSNEFDVDAQPCKQYLGPGIVFCSNCCCELPEGCSGTFKKTDGDYCRLNRKRW